jgi:acyl dehydratase
VNLEALRAHHFATQRVRYDERDVMRYALSVGAGSDPLDARELRLVYEQELLVLPTMAAVLAHTGTWIAAPPLAVNWLQVLHGEQQLSVHRPLPPAAEIMASYRVTAVVDKGADRGALVYCEQLLHEAASGAALCTVSSTLFLRGDGGCGSYGTPPPALPGAALGPIGFSDQLTTAHNAALLYRLNGDLNPIHVDPAAAASAGFARPILHGLCTYGIAGYLLIRTLSDHDPRRLRTLGARFSSPVYPGETVRIEGCRSEAGVQFQASVPERQQLVLTHGFATFA